MGTKACIAWGMFLLVSSAQAVEDVSSQLSLVDLIEQTEPSCVRLDVVYADGSKAIGSGFVADAGQNWVVTNLHVVSGANAVAVRFADNSKRQVKGWRSYAERRDLVVLEIESGKPLKLLKLAKEMPRKGEGAIAIGAPQGLDFTASEGIVSAIRDGKTLKQFGLDAKGTWLQTSTPISPGSSGGPLLNRRGEVIGVNSGSLTSAQNVNFAISCLDVRYVMVAARKGTLRSFDQLPKMSEARRKVLTPENNQGKLLVINIPAKRKYRHRYEIERDDDEFDKVSRLSTEWLPVDHQSKQLTSLGVRVTVVFDQEEVFPIVLWEVGVTARTLQFTKPGSSRFQILGGEESHELPQVKLERSTNNRGTSEIVKGITGLDVFVNIVQSDTIRARVGATEMTFNKQQVECLRDLASQIPTGRFFDGKLVIEQLETEEDSSRE